MKKRPFTQDELAEAWQELDEEATEMEKTISILLDSAVGMGYKTAAVAVSFVHAYVVDETDKAIRIRPYNGAHTLWVPKSALQRIDGTIQGYKLASWFGRSGYAAWFLNRYRRDSILTG